MATTNTRRRVKVYSFSDKNWEDIGTGRVSLTYMERCQSMCIVVRSEVDDSILLESKVLLDQSYRKQEDTLIVWKEDELCDLALSFQEKAGCDELWDEICEVQKHPHDMAVDGELSLLEKGDESISIELPQCELSRLDDILELVNTASTTPFSREVVALMMEKENYIPQLIELFHMCEDLENTLGLHSLYNIFRGLLQMNRIALLNIMFQDEVIDDVIGCLEYDPSKPNPVRHREYIANISKHHEVIPFNNPALVSKIHQTYKVQYVQEVVLPVPSLFEENMMSALNSLLLFNKADIVRMIQEDKLFLRRLFSQLRDDSTAESKFKQLAFLLREICTFSLALELKDRTVFFLALCEYGFLSAVECMLNFEQEAVAAAAVDVVGSVVEFNSSIIRDHILLQADSHEDEGQILNIIISLLVDGQYPELDVQLVGLVKILIDPETIMTETTGGAVRNPVVQNQAMEKSIFLNHFYKHSMHSLMAPLMAQTAGDTVSKDTLHSSALLSNILDILSLCVERHTYHIRKYVIDKNILARVLVLMTSNHKHLALAALRFCRKIVGLKDDFYNRYIIRHNLFAPVVQAFLANGQVYNLLNSAILEMFDFLRMAKIKLLVSYVVETFTPSLEQIEYVDTFQKLKLYSEQMEEPQNNKPVEVDGGILYMDFNANSRYRRDPRQLDEDEEAWFDDEEEEAVGQGGGGGDPVIPLSSVPAGSSLSTFLQLPSLPKDTSSTTSTTVSVTSSSISPPSSPPTHAHHYTSTRSTTATSYSPRPNTSAGGVLSWKPSTILRSNALQSLVDYDEDSDDDMPPEEGSSPIKRLKLGNT